MSERLNPTVNRFLGMVLVLILTGCGTVAVPTNPNSYDVPVGTAAGLRTPQTVTLQNAYPTETVVKVSKTTPAWSSDLRQLTETAIAMLTRALAEQGVNVTSRAEKSVTLRVHTVHATLGGIMIAPRGEARLVLDATYPDGSSTSVDALHTAFYSGQNAVDGAVMLAVSDLLQHPKFLAYMNSTSQSAEPAPPTPPKAAASEATAQRGIPSWLAGTWVAAAPSPGGAHMQDTFQLTVKDDGTFEEIVNSARGGRIDVVGRWQVSGETAILEGVYQGGPSFINTTRKTVTLRRDGDSLDGTRFTHYNNQTHPIRFTKPAPVTFNAPKGETAAPVAADAPASWPLTHIDDTRTIAGTWTGTAALLGTPPVPLTLVLREDGSYESSTPRSRFVGSYGITGGKARYRSTTSGRTGTIELRERDGQRRLIIIIDGGGRAELKPVPK